MIPLANYHCQLGNLRWDVIEKDLKALCNRANISYLDGIPRILPETKFDKILAIYKFDIISIESIKQWNSQCTKSGQQMVVLCDALFDNNIEFDHVKVISTPELLGLSSEHDADFLPVQPKKLYNCFMQRIDPVRQSWFYNLYNSNLLNKGFVNFLLYQMPGSQLSSARDLFDYNHKLGELYNLEKFQLAYEHLKNKIPYRNFEDLEDLTPYILNSKYSLVLETYAVDDSIVTKYISEKTIRALNLPGIDLIFCQKNCLSQLIKHGIYINDDLLKIDNENWQTRQQKILSLLTNDNLEYNIDELVDRCHQNRSVFRNWYFKIKDMKFYEKFIDELR